MLFKKKYDLKKASFGLKFGAILGILFLHIPLFLIILYAFTTEDNDAGSGDWILRPGPLGLGYAG